MRNYGIVFRYLSRTEVINMYKEFRDTTLNGAMSQLYMDLKGKHRAPLESVQVISTKVVPYKDTVREYTWAHAKASLKFPLVKPLKRAPTAGTKATFRATRPQLL